MTCTNHLNKHIFHPLLCLHEAKMTKSLSTCYLPCSHRGQARHTSLLKR
jgi:hypothetical protein